MPNLLKYLRLISSHYKVLTNEVKICIYVGIGYN